MVQDWAGEGEEVDGGLGCEDGLAGVQPDGEGVGGGGQGGGRWGTAGYAFDGGVGEAGEGAVDEY